MDEDWKARRNARIEAAITPRSSGGYSAPRRPAVVRPNWKEWNHTPSVQVWEACALSLDIDPHSLESAGFPSEDSKAEFELRQRVLLANLANRTFFSPSFLNMHSPARCGVVLSEFAAWAVSVMKLEGLPPELVALASALPEADTAPVVSGESPAHTGAAPSGAPEKAVAEVTTADGETGKLLVKQSDASCPAGVDRNRILAAFPPKRGQTSEQWDKMLSEPPRWLKEARIFSGRPGTSALWNPAMVAMSLCDQRRMTRANLTDIMRHQFSDWLPEWEKYTASFD